MVLTSSNTNNPAQESPNVAAGSAAQGGPNAPFDAQGQFPPFGPFMRGGWGRHFRGGAHPFFRSETVPLEGGHDGFYHNHPHHPHPPSPPEPTAHPDPPLASMPPVTPTPGFPEFGPGLTGLMGHHARAFCGDLANHFGVPPPPPPGPGFGPGFGPGSPRDFPGWRGRGGRGGRGGWAGWRGRFPGGPGHHFPHRDFNLPRMDIYQADTTYTVTVELPGLQKQNVDISINEGLLTISGEYPSSSGSVPADDGYAFEDYDIMNDEGEEVEMEARGDLDDPNGGRYIVRERHTGKFKRSIRLPSWVDINTIKATMVDGLLTIVFEKPQPQSSTSSVHKVSIA